MVEARINYANGRSEIFQWRADEASIDAADWAVNRARFVGGAIESIEILGYTPA